MIFNTSLYGKSLPDLNNPGTANDLRQGKQLIDKDGNILTGTIPTVKQPVPSISVNLDTGLISSYYQQKIGYVAYDINNLNFISAKELDSNLIPENIKKGIKIFGVDGTYDPTSSIQTVTINVSNSGGYSYSISYLNSSEKQDGISTNESNKSFTVANNRPVMILANGLNREPHITSGNPILVGSLKLNIRETAYDTEYGTISVYYLNGACSISIY